jgi:hypothetical protein
MENVPVHISNSTPAARSGGARSNGSVSKPGPKKRNLKLISLIVGAVIIVGLLTLGGWFIYRSSTAATIDSTKYQAVFFTNGQVYFGKLQTVNNGYMRLSNIFYLQAQNAEADSQNPQETSNKNSDVQLIKLGNEVHGPDDEMIISKDQILFFENLKKDGKVTDSIKQYQEQQKK